MARYNFWQNKNLVEAASTLSERERQKDRGAFFGSIQRTFSHVFWADQIWLSRFAGTKAPSGGIASSLELIESWAAFRSQRNEFDQRIVDWAHNLKPSWFKGDLTWFSGAAQKQMSTPKPTVVIQFFNHQTHHRGQIHAMLTAASAKPDATDVQMMPAEFLKI